MDLVLWCIVPYSYIENNTPFVEQWIYLLLCFCLSFFSWLLVVCMSQLSPEEPGKAPVSSREHAAFLHMKILRKYIKGGISCRWVDLVVLNILSSSFFQRRYYLKLILAMKTLNRTYPVPYRISLDNFMTGKLMSHGSTCDCVALRMNIFILHTSLSLFKHSLKLEWYLYYPSFHMHANQHVSFNIKIFQLEFLNYITSIL